MEYWTNFFIAKQVKSSLINQNISKYTEFEESTELVFDTGINMTSEYGTNYFIIILHDKWEDCEIDADWMFYIRPPRLISQKHVPITLVGIPYWSLI